MSKPSELEKYLLERLPEIEGFERLVVLPIMIEGNVVESKINIKFIVDSETRKLYEITTTIGEGLIPSIVNITTKDEFILTIKKHLKEICKRSDASTIIGRYYGVLYYKLIQKHLDNFILKSIKSDNFEKEYDKLLGNFVLILNNRALEILNSIMDDCIDCFEEEKNKETWDTLREKRRKEERLEFLEEEEVTIPITRGVDKKPFKLNMCIDPAARCYDSSLKDKKKSFKNLWGLIG